MNSLNATPRGERLHIGIFGNRNAGKSTLFNALLGQDLAVVSPVSGTTTDPVSKAMELVPVGAVLLTDTAGLDDVGEIGELRISKTQEILKKCDIAIVLGNAEVTHENVIYINNEYTDKFASNIEQIRAELITSAQKIKAEPQSPIISDLLSPDDVVVLVTPIDGSAPKGRLILPQQQTIRDILEAGANPLMTLPKGLSATLTKLTAPPRLVITDSQVFAEVEGILPPEIPLTSFSILMARRKGVLAWAVAAAEVIDSLKSGDKVYICEGCTHNVQCDDIGRVKLPKALEKHTGAKLNFAFTAGGDFPDVQELTETKLIIHCGGCMQSRREMASRQSVADEAEVPMCNYGIALAFVSGILTKCMQGLTSDEYLFENSK